MTLRLPDVTTLTNGAATITFDASTRVAYVALPARSSPRTVARTVEIAPDVLADYAADGTLLGIELVGCEAA
jgi:uncharacterized protein YuzE